MALDHVKSKVHALLLWLGILQCWVVPRIAFEPPRKPRFDDLVIQNPAIGQNHFGNRSLISVLPFSLDFDFLVVAKVRDELLGPLCERLASLGRVGSMQPNTFPRPWCMTVMVSPSYTPITLPVKCSAVARVDQNSSDSKIGQSRRHGKVTNVCVIFGCILL